MAPTWLWDSDVSSVPEVVEEVAVEEVDVVVAEWSGSYLDPHELLGFSWGQNSAIETYVYCAQSKAK